MSKIIKASEVEQNIRAEQLDFAELDEEARRVIERAEKKASKIYDEAVAVLENAREVAAAAETDRRDAAKILADAENRAAAAAAEAREAAHAEGLELGKKEGFERGMRDGVEKAHSEAFGKAFEEKQAAVEQESAPVMDALTGLLEEIESSLEHVASRARSDLVALAVAVAEKIVRREISLDPSITVASVHKAIELSMKKHTVRVFLNPDDLAVVSRYVPTLKAAFSRVEVVELKPSERIAPGGCEVESGSGTVDMKVETQLAKIERELLQKGGESA